MKCFRNIVAILMLVSMMPLARASADLSGAAVSQRACCRQKTDACCKGSAKACCATQAPADTALFPSQDVLQWLLPPLTVPAVYTGRIGSLTAQCATLRLPAEHSPPGLLMVATTILRI